MEKMPPQPTEQERKAISSKIEEALNGLPKQYAADILDQVKSSLNWLSVVKTAPSREGYYSSVSPTDPINKSIFCHNKISECVRELNAILTAEGLKAGAPFFELYIKEGIIEATVNMDYLEEFFKKASSVE